MSKTDFKKSMKSLYDPSAQEFSKVNVPILSFLTIDGEGDPNTAGEYRTGVEWLFGVSYAMKFAAKASLARDYVVPPLEALWWADDPKDFVNGTKDRWKWTIMIMTPEFVPDALFDAAVEKTGKKLGKPPAGLRREAYDEGLSLQILHVGSYDDEAPTLKRLHEVEMPARNLAFNGPHHEIYLSDPRKVEASKLRTILRQPVRPIASPRHPPE